MSLTTTLGLLCVVVAIAEVALGFALGIAAKRRGGGFAVGAVLTAICGVVAWQAASVAPLYVAVVAQLVALVSLGGLLRTQPGTAGHGRTQHRAPHA